MTHTPGPWAWFGNSNSNSLYLATTHSGRRYVMGFKRWGMRGAQPQFQPGGRGLVDASELLKFEVGDKSVTGVEEAKKDGSVYRYDVRGIDCDDARLIAAAPDLLEALKTCCEAIGALRKRMKEIPSDISAEEAFDSFYTGNVDDALNAACHAIAKADASAQSHYETAGNALGLKLVMLEEQV